MHFQKDHLLLLTAQEISEAVSTFVDKQENDAILAECLSQMEKTTEHILNKVSRRFFGHVNAKFHSVVLLHLTYTSHISSS